MNVTAANHGVNGKDCLVLKQANVTVTSGGDALRATNDSDSALGCILIGASALTLMAGEDGIQAETTLTLFDTTGTITSGDGSSASLAGDTSAKGIKAGTDITVRSGSYTLDCADDGIHANGNVTVSGGTFAITTGDDGVHADEAVHDHGRHARDPPSAMRALKARPSTFPAARSTSSPVTTDSTPRAARTRAASAAAPTAALQSPAAPSASTRAATVSTPTAT